MASFNKVILIGRLTRDPEKRYTSSGLAVTSFSIAVDRFGKDPQTGDKKTDFFRCTAWRQKAEFVADYIQKGRLVCVEGRIELNEYVGQDGQKRFSTDVVCDGVELLESTRDMAGDAAPSGASAGSPRGRRDEGGSQGHDDNGYFPDEEAVSQRSAPRASAPRDSGRGDAGRADSGRSAGRDFRDADEAPARSAPARRPAPAAYPDDDFDDSDPFADE